MLSTSMLASLMIKLCSMEPSFLTVSFNGPAFSAAVENVMDHSFSETVMAAPALGALGCSPLGFPPPHDAATSDTSSTTTPTHIRLYIATLLDGIARLQKPTTG